MAVEIERFRLRLAVPAQEEPAQNKDMEHIKPADRPKRSLRTVCRPPACARKLFARGTFYNDGRPIVKNAPYASIAPCAASNCFSAFMIGHHSVNARTIGTPRPMMDMQRQLINSLLASIYVLLCIVGYSFRRRADWFSERAHALFGRSRTAMPAFAQHYISISR